VTNLAKKTKNKEIKKTHYEGISVLGATARPTFAFHSYAADFLAAAKSAALPPPPNPYLVFAPARPYLVCHALELALKAFLSLKGEHGVGELANKFQHDLKKLLDEAERLGLRADVAWWGDEQASQIGHASVYYSNKVFEYPALGEMLSGYSDMPDTNILIDLAEKLITALQEPCGAALEISPIATKKLIDKELSKGK
jgi:hypothetical protein